MNAQHPDAPTFADDALTPSARQPFSRRRLFEFGGAAAAMAAVLAACGNDGGGAPGRVGLAPTTTALPTATVDDAVFLRTLQSLEYSTLGMYERFAAEGGLEGQAAAALERFTTDHTEAAAELDSLLGTVGGTPFACPNPWYEARFFGPALDNIFGGTNSDGEIPVSDDIPRDVLTMIWALESLATSSSLHFIPQLSTPELRSAVIALGAKASRRAATATLLRNPAPVGYLSPEIIEADGGEVPTVETEPPATDASADSTPDAAPIVLPYVISTRFAQLTAVSIEIGAVNELGLRYKSAFETPADNAFVYNSLTCDA